MVARIIAIEDNIIISLFFFLVLSIEAPSPPALVVIAACVCFSLSLFCSSINFLCFSSSFFLFCSAILFFRSISAFLWLISLGVNFIVCSIVSSLLPHHQHFSPNSILSLSHFLQNFFFTTFVKSSGLKSYGTSSVPVISSLLFSSKGESSIKVSSSAIDSGISSSAIDVGSFSVT